LVLAVCGWRGLTSTPVLAASPLQQAESAPSIWSVVLPLLVAALALERTIEIVWNYIEWILLSTRRMQPADLRSAHYLQFKSGSSLILGIVVGILVANYTGMRLFAYMLPFVPGFADAIPPLWDIIITGAVLGAAAKPIHELLGIITQFKNFLGYAAVRQRESASAALADGVLKLAESDRKMMIDVPGVGPARLPAAQADGDGEEEGAKEPSRTERYVALLRNRTAD
jgi:hypothetical protein